MLLVNNHISDYIRLSYYQTTILVLFMLQSTIFSDPFPMLKSQARRDLRPGVATLRGHRRGRLRCTPFGGRGMVKLRDFWVKKYGDFNVFNVEFRSDSPKKWGFQFWFNDFGWIWDLRSSPKTSGFKFWFPQEWRVGIDFEWCICLWKMMTFWWRFNGDEVTVVCLVSWIFLGIIITHKLEKST